MTPLIVDLDNDLDYEIVTTDNKGNFYAYQHNGDLIWSTYLAENSYTSFAHHGAAGDIDNDGDNELLIGDGGACFHDDLPVWRFFVLSAYTGWSPMPVVRSM